MGHTIFFLDSNTAMKIDPEEYKGEDDLQAIIRDNPDVLLREQDREKDNQLHLVKRELPLPGINEGESILRLDHFLVDNNAIPVLVEVKCVSNPQSRREVVGQMLDYAARISYYDSAELRDMYMESNHGEESPVNDSYSFWKQVSSNIRSGNMRLIFAADSIPSTLKVLIELMDRSMPYFDVYGVEISKHSLGGKKYLTTSLVQNLAKTFGQDDYHQQKSKWSDSDMKRYLDQIYGDWAFQFFKKFRKTATDLKFTGKYGSAEFIPYRFSYNGIKVFSFCVDEVGGSIYFLVKNICGMADGMDYETVLSTLQKIDPDARYTKTIHPANLKTRLKYLNDRKNQDAILSFIEQIREVLPD